MAMAIWPGLIFLELPSLAAGRRSLVSALSTAISVSGSRPSTRAGTRRESVSASSMAEAPSTTWLLVSTMPSGDRMVPEPEPWAGRPCASPAHLHVHDGRRHRLHHADNRARIGVEQFLVLTADGPIGNERGIAISAPQLHAANSQSWQSAPQGPSRGSPAPNGPLYGVASAVARGVPGACQACRRVGTKVCRSSPSRRLPSAEGELRQCADRRTAAISPSRPSECAPGPASPWRRSGP